MNSYSFFKNLAISLRPEQWTKNLIIFAGLIFGRQLFEPTACLRAAGAFSIFCGLSGVVYLINDIIDRRVDSHHPLKSQRPIASGKFTLKEAIVSIGLIGTTTLTTAFWLDTKFGFISLGYAVLFIAYSTLLKHIIILDVLTISIGFVLRAAAGAIVLSAPISYWLLVCTILLALFLAFSKRRHEIVMLEDLAVGHRPSLSEYSPYLLDQMISVVAASTVIAYAVYTLSPATTEKFGTDLLGLTVCFPLYGILRYLYLIHQREGGGNPSELLLRDLPLLLCIVLWALSLVVIIYRPS